jgi:hypothetical protein
MARANNLIINKQLLISITSDLENIYYILNGLAESTVSNDMLMFVLNSCGISVEEFKNMPNTEQEAQEMANNVLSIAPGSNGKVIIIPNELGQKKDSISFPNLSKKVVVGCAASHLNEKKGIGNLLYMISGFKAITDIPITLELVGDIDSDLRDKLYFYYQQFGDKQQCYIFWL